MSAADCMPHPNVITDFLRVSLHFQWPIASKPLRFLIDISDLVRDLLHPIVCLIQQV